MVTMSQLLRPAGVVLGAVEGELSDTDPNAQQDRVLDIADRLGDIPDSG